MLVFALTSDSGKAYSIGFLGLFGKRIRVKPISSLRLERLKGRPHVIFLAVGNLSGGDKVFYLTSISGNAVRDLRSVRVTAGEDSYHKLREFCRGIRPKPKILFVQ